MASQKGKELLLKVGDGATSESFTTVGGLRSTSISLNREMVDITNKDSTNQFREGLAGAGVKSATFSGSGVFTDTAAEETVRADYFSDAFTNYQVIVPDFGTFEGPFQITALNYAGEYNGEVTYDVTLESVGDVAFTSA